MGSATREAKAKAAEAIRAVPVSSSGALADALFTFADALGSVPQLRALVTDPSSSVEDRTAVVDAVFSEKFDSESLAFIRDLVSAPWSRPSELVASVADLAVTALTGIAASRGPAGVESLIDELYGAARVFSQNQELQQAVRSGRRGAALSTLVETIFGSHLSPEALKVVEFVASHKRGGVVAPTLLRYAATVAEADGRKLATITTAIPLAAEKRAALVRSLEKQFGEQLHAGYVVNPSVIGGVRAEVGSEIIDATTKTKLGELRASLVH